MNDLYTQLTRYDSSAWRVAVETLSAAVHPIDRNATRIWFAFYPLELHLALEAAPDQAEAARKLGLMGKWRLADQVDSSHRFLFAHRYWPQVKSAIQGAPESLPADLAALISTIAESAARTARVDREFLLGIAAVLLMTLRQAGPDAFAAAPTSIHLSDKVRVIERPVGILADHIIIAKTHPNARVLLHYVNAALAKLKTDGKFDEIVEKHLTLFWDSQTNDKPAAPAATEPSADATSGEAFPGTFRYNPYTGSALTPEKR